MPIAPLGEKATYPPTTLLPWGVSNPKSKSIAHLALRIGCALIIVKISKIYFLLLNQYLVFTQTLLSFNKTKYKQSIC